MGRISATLAAALIFAASAATASATDSTPAGSWRALTIAGKAVRAEPSSMLDLAPDGTVSGTGGCNRMAGKAKIDGEAISFGPLAGTMMMCKDRVMKQERAFQDALGKATSWRLERKGRRLVLLNAAKMPVVVLVRQKSAG